MSCGACTRRYGFFCKESGCPNCGFSFCTKCLKKDIEVPRCGGSKYKVCLRCFEQLEKEKSMEKEIRVPTTVDVLAQNEPKESLAAPLKPICLGKDVTCVESDKGDDDDDKEEDNEIADNLDKLISNKLDKLKNGGIKALPNDSDMAERLAALKGIPHREYSSKDVLLLMDTRTDQEKINDLVKQFIDEKSIDEATESGPIADIERRLARLKGISLPTHVSGAESSKNCITLPDSKEDDEDIAIKEVLDQFLEEAKLPNALLIDEEKAFFGSLPSPNKNTEELPWCTICNEDASIRCLECDGGLFCAACFRECHDDDDFREHKSQAYQKPPTFEDNNF